jgi:hypothetical protein
VIHLKRFDFVNGRWMKSDKMVNFPLEDLHLTARMPFIEKKLNCCANLNAWKEASTQREGGALRGAHQWQRVEGRKQPVGRNGIARGFLAKGGSGPARRRAR